MNQPKWVRQMTWTNGDVLQILIDKDNQENTIHIVYVKREGVEMEWRYFSMESAKSKFNDYKEWLLYMNKPKTDTSKYCSTCRTLLNENLECEDCIENE